ncbi:hypothetical protein J7413_15655 [Shimia sp. R10_1]|uniref:hypothetical protein n=1 Tax=Shimia sp. R10_1 TaxID=2821095 RepID=UPI001ADC5546|nr:hypothetical protein [Shimia sp. R10_1]MBO9474983.1 hypothetical protein [Shimia sp. R10_1]
MPTTINIFKEISVTHVTHSGALTMPELRDAWKTVYEDPDFEVGMNEIVDCSATTAFDIGFDEMLAFAKDSQAIHAARQTKITLIIIAPSNMSSKVADMFTDLAAAVDHGNDLVIVQGYPEAFALLDLSPEDIALFPASCHTESHLL